MRNNFLLLAMLIASSLALGGNDSAAQDAEYELRFEGLWTTSVARPGGAHFTQIIGSTHATGESFLTIGQEASLGVENVAELGSTGALISEINADITAGNADSLLLGTDTFIDPLEVNTFNFFANVGHSNVSFMTMLAPSPDWFVGIHDVDLRDGSGWRSQIILNLENYDAGSEDGSGFSLNNSATTPRGVIAMLDGAEPTGALFGSGSISRVTLTRISAVPEPGSILVLAGMGLAFVSTRRRK